ncbi:hypothetical protein [Methylobacterium sp. BE186]
MDALTWLAGALARLLAHPVRPSDNLLPWNRKPYQQP